MKINVALAHPYHAGKSCSKFGYIPHSGLGGGNGVMYGLTDGSSLKTDFSMMPFIYPRVYRGLVKEQYSIMNLV